MSNTIFAKEAVKADDWIGKPVRDESGKTVGTISHATAREDGAIVGRCRMFSGLVVDAVFLSPNAESEVSE